MIYSLLALLVTIFNRPAYPKFIPPPGYCQEESIYDKYDKAQTIRAECYDHAWEALESQAGGPLMPDAPQLSEAWEKCSNLYPLPSLP